MATQVKEKAEVILIDAEGVLINSALFERDAYTSENGGAPGKPMYKVEIAYTPKDIEDFEDKMADLVDKDFGKGEGDKFLKGEAGFVSPLIDGNLLAAGREAKGKAGDAYKGKLVLRAKTGFNKDGDEGPGGAKVYGPDTSPIEAANQSEIYNGCIGKVAVTLKTYKDFPVRGTKGVTVYLSAFQKIADGTPLRSSEGSANPFKPAAGAPAPGRRSRAG